MLNNNRALLVVDLQQNYINENVFPRTAQIARGVEQELQHGYQLVLVTRMHVQPHGPLEVEPELPALGFEPLERALFFVKQTLSAATDEVLTLLAGHGIHRVDICGISTESCVMATAFALHDSGFQVNVLGQYCASIDANPEDARIAHNKAIYLLYRNNLTRHWMQQRA